MLRCLLRGPQPAAQVPPHPGILPYIIPGLCLNADRALKAQKPPFFDPLSATTSKRSVHGSSRRLKTCPIPFIHPFKPTEARRRVHTRSRTDFKPKTPPQSAYFRASAPQVRDIERVLASPHLAGEILAKLHSETLSEADAQAMQSLVCSAVDWASSTHSKEAYSFLLDAWHIVNHERRLSKGLAAIRTALGENRDRLIHMMLNRGDYDAYTELLAPLYVSKPASSRSWAMLVMETVRPRLVRGTYLCDGASMAAYLDSSSVHRDQKHRMVAVYVTKSLLASRTSENVAYAVRTFAEMFSRIEDTLLVAQSPYFAVYKRPLALLASLDQGTTERLRLEQIHSALIERVSTAEFSDFVSALSHATAQTHPQMTVVCWQYKLEMLSGTRTGTSSRHDRAGRPSKDDMTQTMLAYVNLRAYDRALAVYAAHPELQDDAQITLLLRASESNKDWKLLQRQFEDMYGRGDLPHVTHYAVVMGALASLGATTEVEQLYAQLLRRNLEPTAPVFHALVRACVNANDGDAALRWHETFLKHVENGAIDPCHVPTLQLELLEAKLPSMGVSAAVIELERLAAEQTTNQTPLVDARMIRALLRHMSSLYSLRGFEACWAVAQKLALVDEGVLNDALAFLTKMGHFRRVDDMIYEAHLESAVPFQNSLLLAAELHNACMWRKETTDSGTHRLLGHRVSRIIAQTDNGGVSPKHLDALLAGIIRHFTGMGRPDSARAYLDRANAANLSDERHFLPFLKEYSAEGSYDDNSDVLNLYREMVARKTVISARTYYYLSRSLLIIDAANKRDHSNSFNLLQSVLEMYGFAVLQEQGTTKVSMAQLSKSAVPLLRIVADYATQASARNEETMNLVLNFLKQMRAKLDKHIDYTFRVAILTEMSKVYRVYGDLHVAGSLIDNALEEMDEIIEQLPQYDPLPKLLQLDYRKAIDIKNSVLMQRSAGPADYVAVLQNVLSHNVRLSAYQIHDLGHKVLATSPPSKHVISLVLDACEQFLVAGNWAEVKVGRKIHYIYRVYLAYLGRTMSPAAIANRYALFNRLYDIKDVDAVLKEHENLRDPRARLESALKEYVEMNPRDYWTLSKFFEETASFFAPERTFASRNLIQPNLAAVLVKAIEQICDGQNEVAFGLYDEFPDTMEYLLFYVGERTRIVSFRLGVSEKLGKGNSPSVESRAARRRVLIDSLREDGATGDV